MNGAASVGYFESGTATLDYARQVDALVESLNTRISESRALNGLKGFPWEDWIDFKRTWGMFRDEVNDSWITWGMFDTVRGYHRQAQAWGRLYERLSKTKSHAPNVPIAREDDDGGGFDLGTIALVGAAALAAGLLWNRSKKS